MSLLARDSNLVIFRFFAIRARHQVGVVRYAAKYMVNTRLLLLLWCSIPLACTRFTADTEQCSSVDDCADDAGSDDSDDQPSMDDDEDAAEDDDSVADETATDETVDESDDMPADESAEEDDSTPSDDATPSDETDEPPTDDVMTDDVTDDTVPDEPPDVIDDGDECNEPSEERVKAYFEVPGTMDADLGDYFRLPFPNDFYLQDGQLDLGDYPAVTSTAAAFVEAAENLSSGFSASPTMYYRFSGRVDFDTLVSRFHMLDITDPNSTSSPPLKLLYSPGSGKYLCHNSLAVRPAPGYALNPGATYATWIDSGVLGESGLEVTRSPQLQAMLEATPPADPTLAALHAKYAPLRNYFEIAGVAPSTVLNATVFTVEDPREPMRVLSQLVGSLSLPEASDWVHCDGVNTSPCPDAEGTRACGAPNELYDEYHALVGLPIFQEGTAPYFDEGGQVSLSGAQRTEMVCMSVSVPKAPAPATGYPVVVHGHGAGGSFRSALSPSIAGMLSQATAPDGQVVPAVVIGYDLVQHGPRRGDSPFSNIDPDLLLFNFLNAPGTVGTALQGAVDVISMGRFARTMVIPDTVSVTGPVPLKQDAVFFWGHSQGATHGAVAIPYTDDYHSAVFTGLGAGFAQTLLLRKDPELIPDAVAAAVYDPGPDGELVYGGEFHPALALVQHVVDAADPLHHAELLVSRSETLPTNVFQVYGTDDAFSPGIAQLSFATAADLEVVQTDASATTPDDLGDISSSFPLVGNLRRMTGEWTAGVRQYGPEPGENGHFVGFDIPSAQQDIAGFLSSAVLNGTPQIGR